MTRFLIALAVAGAAVMGCANASERLIPGNGYSIRLGGYVGALYYTAADGDFRVVATLASGDAIPVRLVSMLAPGQRVIVSVPGAAGEPSIELAVVREGEMLRIDNSSSAAVISDEHAPVEMVLGKALRGR